jgi:predicted DNA-binding transcriptional regulator AlpA
MLSTQRSLSSTDMTRVLGISRQALCDMKRRGGAPKSIRVGSVSLTPVQSFIDWIARELARATRPRFLRRLGKA